MRAAAALAPLLLVAACARYPEPTPVPQVVSLPTRGARIVPTATAAPPTPTPRPTAVPRTFTAGDFDRYAALYATERDGSYVTTRRPDGRYYYRWDDRRWYGVADRVWFRSVEDLKTVYPDRVPAP